MGTGMHTGLIPGIHRTFSGQSIASLGFEYHGGGPVMIQRIGTPHSLIGGAVYDLTNSTMTSTGLGSRVQSSASRRSSNSSVQSFGHGVPAAAATQEDIMDFLGGGRPLRPA
jgi:hypothetical protein